MSDISQKVDKIFESVYTTSDIEEIHTKGFETYITKLGGVIPGFAIGYNPKTGLYGLKRYDLVTTLYEAENIPMENKPDFKKLYQKVKNLYMCQVICENIADLEI